MKNKQGFTLIEMLIVIVIIVLLAGMVLISLGRVGEYVGRIYMETKRRPRYFVAEACHHPAEKE